MRKKHTIIYKSGRTLTVKCSEITCVKRGGTLTEIWWTNDISPRPLHAGVDDIAAVYVHE